MRKVTIKKTYMQIKHKKIYFFKVLCDKLGLTPPLSLRNPSVNNSLSSQGDNGVVTGW